MNFIRISAINKGLADNRADYISRSEDNYYSQLRFSAEQIIIKKDTHPLVLISGPSGSGKTTSALKIANIISNSGTKVHTLSMDNYFLPYDSGDLPVDENGNTDLESPYRLDIKLFGEHLKKLSACEPIDIPIFDFASQLRKGSVRMCRSENEIVIIEGIHALNPEVTGSGTDDFTTRIYVSVRTRITSADQTVLHPRLIRLMRRLCRDKLFRGRQFEDIFDMFESVSRGEELYIMPHKQRATINIDTFMAYEASVYTGFLREDLALEKSRLEKIENYDLIMKFMNELHPIRSDGIPDDSLIREFVGGSSLQY